MADKKPQEKPKRNPADHLKKHQIKPGQVLNPKGRPKKGSAIADILNEIGDEILNVNGGEITKREAIMRRIYSEAVKGNMAAINFIADRTEGKAVERVENKNVQQFEYELKQLKEKSPDELITEINKALNAN